MGAKKLDAAEPTPWMDLALTHKGKHEIPGTRLNNEFIVDLFKHTTYKTTTDETPWCAAFVCAMLERSGYKSTRSAAAKSYDKYGIKSELKYAAIVTIKYKSSGRRHVTLCERVSRDGVHFYGYGGNQANMVKTSKYRIDEIVAVRWPIK